MSTNSLIVVGRPGRFERTVTQFVRPVPPSPMVLQRFVQVLTDLEHKVEALAKRPAQIVEVRPVEAKEVKTKPPAKVPQVKAEPPAKAHQSKVDRRSLWDIFD